MQVFVIAFIFLLLTIKMPLIWSIYILFLPGYSILSLTDLKTKEKILFAMPFSILLVHWPYFLITRMGLGLPPSYFTIIPLIYATIYLIKRKDELNALANIKFDGRIKKDTLYTLILATVLFYSFYYSFQSFVSPAPNTGVPRTLGAKYIAETQILKDNILAGNGAIGWSSDWFSGMHTFTSYSPLSYLILAVDSLNNEVWKMHNVDVFLFSFLFAIYLYYLLRHIEINKYTALAISLISATLPPFIQVNNVLKTSIDFAFLPLLIYSLLLLLEKPDRTNTILLAVTTSMFIMNFYLTMFILIYPLILFTIYYIYKSKKTVKTLTSLTKAGLLAFLIGGIWLIPFIQGSLTKTFSMMSYAEGGWHSPQKSASEILDHMTRAIDPSNIPFDSHSFTTFSPQFFYIGIISSIIILLLSLKTSKKENINFCLATIPLTLLAYIFVQLTPLREILPVYYAVYGKIYLYFPLIPLFAISTSQVIETISKRIKYASIISIIALIILFLPVFQYSHNMGTFLSEGSVVNENNLAWLYRPLEQVGNGGSFILFGLYGPGYIPGITQYSNIEAFSGYGHESHSTIQAYEKRIIPFQEATMDYLLTDNAAYAYNIFKQSNVRALVFQRCSYNNMGQTVINPDSSGEYAYQTLTKDPRFRIITNESCIALMTTTNPKKSEKIYLTEILVKDPDKDQSGKIKYATTHDHLSEMLNNREKSINALLQAPQAEHLHFTAKQFAMPTNYYKNIIINRTATAEEINTYLKNNSTVIYFRDDIKIDNPNFHTYSKYPENTTDLNEILKKAGYIDTEVPFNKDDNSYELDEDGLVLIKETYFRKWHSNADIIESYLGFILVDAKGPTNIWYAPTAIDYLGGLLTIIGILATLIMIHDQTDPRDRKEREDKNEKEKKQKSFNKRRPKKRKRKR